MTAGNQKDLYSMLSEELIDNNYDFEGQTVGLMRSPPSNYQDACSRTIKGRPRSGDMIHLTPSKHLTKKSKGEQIFRYQGRCKECQKKTTWECLDCANTGKRCILLCSTKNGQ
jgi:hypothetical protein